MNKALLICLFGILISTAFGEKCAVKTQKRYFAAEWSADRLSSISKGDASLDIYFVKGQEGMEPIIDFEVYASSEDEGKKYDFVILNGTGPFIESASIKKAEENSGNNHIQSNMMIGAAALTSAVILNNEEYHPIISYGIPMAMMATAALAEECTVSAILRFTIAPADFDATWLSYNESFFTTDANSVNFVDKEGAPSEADCTDPIVSIAFPVTCLGVPPRTEAIVENQPLLLDNVFKFYNGAKFPHQECALRNLQTSIEGKNYFKTFSCQFRAKTVDGSYCGSVILLRDVPPSYNPTSFPHQKTAVDNLQKSLEGETSIWRSFQSHWRRERVCPTWEIRSDGRCGASFGNAGCSPDRNPCCSVGGWCGITDDHCGNGGVDYRNGLPTAAPAKQTVRGPACNNNNPGVCIDENVCAKAGGTSTAGLCPGAANIKCCGGPNVIAQVVTVISGRKCSGNHPSTQTPGVCISSSACTSAGGETAKGLCPYDGADILCCNGENVKVEYQVSGKSCGNYASSEVTKIQGNNNVIYDVVKVLQSHLVDSSAFYSAPTQRDNTMEVTTACNFDRMRTAALADGVNIRIASAFRTFARQQYFWNCYQCGCCNGGNLAARPGTSNHGTGRALDLNTDCGRQSGSRPNCSGSSVYRWLFNNAQRFGFVRTVQSEPWHWEYIPGESRAWYS